LKSLDLDDVVAAIELQEAEEVFFLKAKEELKDTEEELEKKKDELMVFLKDK